MCVRRCFHVFNHIRTLTLNFSFSFFLKWNYIQPCRVSISHCKTKKIHLTDAHNLRMWASSELTSKALSSLKNQSIAYQNARTNTLAAMTVLSKVKSEWERQTVSNSPTHSVAHHVKIIGKVSCIWSIKWVVFNNFWAFSFHSLVSLVEWWVRWSDRSLCQLSNGWNSPVLTQS